MCNKAEGVHAVENSAMQLGKHQEATYKKHVSQRTFLML